jgi:hypothetical protein
MKLRFVEPELFAEAERLIVEAQYEAANEQLEAIHAEYHCEPFVHLRIHVMQWRIARRQGRVLKQMGQILPIVFSVPVSWVQRHLGLALPGRMGKRGC